MKKLQMANGKWQMAIVVVVLLATGYWLLAIASAQSPSRLYLTWQAINFYPSDYQGKAAAATGSDIIVSAVLVRNSRVLDTQQAQITWYLDGSFFNRAVGLNEIKFKTSKLKGDEHFVRAVINLENETIEGAVTIPVSSQEVVIESPYPDDLLVRGTRAVLKSIPYFFNVQSVNSLSFFWNVDNVTSEERSNLIQLDIGTSPSLTGREVFITSAVVNNNNQIESARVNKRLTIR